VNKGQGIAMGAILAAAFMLRQVGSGPALGEAGESPKTEANSPSQSEAKVGPWIASCNYWAPARLTDRNQPEVPAEIHGAMRPVDGQVNLHVRLREDDEKKELRCGSDSYGRWGFPKHKVKITAIIATVPDPVHTHLALAFDRTIDAILQAASDGDYVSSYYWLPWKNRATGFKVCRIFGRRRARSRP
jgi:hypothetical protein